MIKNEVWKSIPGILGVEAGSHGDICTLDYAVCDENGERFRKGRLLTQHDNGRGYLQVNVPLNGKWVTKKTHRLVAQAFIPNPNNLSEVNHKNGNRTCNDISNLEWVTHKENIEYREKHGKSAKETTPKTPVCAINLTTFEVLQFPSQHEAGRSLGVYQSCINYVIKGKRKATGGYWFLMADSNSVESVRRKFGDEVADKVEELMKDTEMQSA